MARNNRKVRINRKKGGGSRPFVYLIIVVLLIILAFFLLEKLKKPHLPPVPSPPASHKEPQKIVKPDIPPSKPHEVQRRYSTAVTAPQPKPLPRPLPPLEPIGRGSVAIIIDDMGSSLREVESLMDINIPLTFAVIPGLGKSREVAAAAGRRSYEVMIHLPMEPRDYPARRLEKNGLLVAESNEEIRSQVSEYLREVPFAGGANNHMGSRFTEDAGKMEAALKPLSERGFYFVDSMTSARSQGKAAARGLGMRAASRDVFLDNVQDVNAIRSQIRVLAGVAAKKGHAIGICHPHKATIQALAAELPLLRQQGITFVSASALVR